MKFSVVAALLAAVALAGCMGPEGNPDRSAYANESGGAMSVTPQTVGTVHYDPYGKPAPFADMQAGAVALNPPSPGPGMAPMPLPPAYPPRR
ncbi:MAG TPA: hypothetical protein VFI23_10085 [Rhizomicrobium sp.]|nr:hypothetical protein [Rhizomicrobium sp.]